MDEQRLWAPWRMSYIAGDKSAETTSQEPIAWLPGADTACFICKATAAYADEAAARRQNLVLEVSNHTITMLNLYPYNNGHLMIVPHRHIAQLAQAEPDELNELMALTRRAEMVLTEAYAPHGLNVGLNLGRAAGAGVADHLHIHVVPRWNGDTNFMTVVSETRVLPEALDQTAARLRPIFDRLSSS
jgi:ATP adenylyltransferase